MTALTATHDAIRDLQQRHSTLTHQFANDSQGVHERLDRHDVLLEHQREQGAHLAEQIAKVRREFFALRDRRFWARLRWLLFGR